MAATAMAATALGAGEGVAEPTNREREALLENTLSLLLLLLRSPRGAEQLVASVSLAALESPRLLHFCF